MCQSTRYIYRPFLASYPIHLKLFNVKKFVSTIANYHHSGRHWLAGIDDGQIQLEQIFGLSLHLDSWFPHSAGLGYRYANEICCWSNLNDKIRLMTDFHDAKCLITDGGTDIDDEKTSWYWRGLPTDLFDVQIWFFMMRYRQNTRSWLLVIKSVRSCGYHL